MLKLNGMLMAAALGLVIALPQTAAAGSSETKVYPYATSHNYCPAGLQPVTINGVICCGTPNQNVSYQSMMAHPVAQKKHRKVVHKTYRAQSNCQIGTKGCTYD